MVLALHAIREVRLVTVIEYERTPDGWKFHDRDGTGLTIFAEKIGLDRWGKQRAKVVIAQNGRALDFDELDINDRATRNTLANSAADQCDPPLKGDGKKELRQLLLDFMDSLWEQNQSLAVATVGHGDAVDSQPATLIPGLIVDGGGHLLFAPPGAGKSWMGYLLQQALTQGLHEPFRATRKASALLVNLERPERSVTRRMGRINLSLGLDRETPFYAIHNRGGTLQGTLDTMRRAVQQDGHEVVILDSLSRSGASLVDDNEANRAMDALNSLGVTWIAIAHSPYGDNSKTFGSRMFQAAADVEIRMDSQVIKRHLKAVRLRPVKANDILPETHIFGQEYHLDYGLARIWRSDEHEFYARTCDGFNRGKPCEAMTWSGVDLINGTYCARHRMERRDDD